MNLDVSKETIDEILENVETSEENKTTLRHLLIGTPISELNIKFASGAGFSIEGGMGYPLEIFMEHANNVYKLKDCDGFDDLLSGLKNPTQVDDTFFESLAAVICLENPFTKAIQFGKEVGVSGSMKKPDFIWITELGEFICEVKDLNPSTHSEYRTFTRRANCLLESVKGNTPDNYRLEIFLKDGILKSDFKLIQETLEILEKGKQDKGNLVESESLQVIVVPMESDKYFVDVNLRLSNMTVGEKATK